MKKGKKKRQPEDKGIQKSSEENQVLLGIRVSEKERQGIKMYAVQHNTTVTELIREYIGSLLKKM